MKRILSESLCNSLVNTLPEGRWKRIDKFGRYDQMFISDSRVDNEIQLFFNRPIKESICKILRFNQGDYIPTFSADYSSSSDDEYFSRYRNTNFIIPVFLNSNFKGGEMLHRSSLITPEVGAGFIQTKTDRCSKKEVTDGTSYMLFYFILSIKSQALL